MITDNKSSFDNKSIKMFTALFLEANLNKNELSTWRESFTERAIKDIGFDESIIKSICSININLKASDYIENLCDKSNSISSYVGGLKSIENKYDNYNYDFEKLRDCAKDFMLFNKKSKVYTLLLDKESCAYSSYYTSSMVKDCISIMDKVNLSSEECYSLFELSKVYDTNDEDLFNFILSKSNSKYLFKDIYFSIKRKKGYVDKKCQVLETISKRGIVVDEIIDYIADSSHKRIRESVAVNLIKYYRRNKNSDKDMSKVISTIRKFNSLEDYSFLKLVIDNLPKDELKWYVTTISKFSWLQREFNRVVNQ